MQRSTWLMLPAVMLVCSLAPTVRADLLGSFTFDAGAGGGTMGEPPVLLALFANIAPSGLPFPSCDFGPFLPAPGQPCFYLFQENLTTADVGTSFVIDENTNSDFATITSLLANGSRVAVVGATYPAGIVPVLPVANVPPPGALGGEAGGEAFDLPTFPNDDITQLQLTLTSFTPGIDENSIFSVRLDVYGELVPEPPSSLTLATGLVALFGMAWCRRRASAGNREH